MAPILSLASLDDEATRRLVRIARLVTLARLAPWGNRLLVTFSATFTTTMRVIDRVHRDTAHPRPLSKPSHTSGLAETLIHMLVVADRTDGGYALLENKPEFIRRQLDGDIVSIDIGRASCRERV